MNLPGMSGQWRQFDGVLPIRSGVVDRDGWLDVARQTRESGGRLLTIWAIEREQAVASAAFVLPGGLHCIELPLGEQRNCPDLADIFPASIRMQRAAADLSGVLFDGARDQRPWLDHGVWTVRHPLRGHDEPSPGAGGLPAPYAFVRVEGDGVHEVPVGPVHAGIIEPGHFRFSVVGEKVLRLEERLGYTHKGVERRFGEIDPLAAHRLAGRFCGDSTVAHAWAYCMALESAVGCAIPARAQWLRALLLERERVANHLGDIGAIANDAAFVFGMSHFSRLREDWLRSSARAWGHRLLMDRVVPGGVVAEPDAPSLARMREHCRVIEAEVRALRAIYEEHAGLWDRFSGAGRVVPDLAAQLGLTGLAGRASGQANDLRCDFAWPPYSALGVVKAGSMAGDVAARVAVRFDELLESLRLIAALIDGLPPGDIRRQVSVPAQHAVGFGWIEGWRGEVFVALELGPDGRIRRCHCHDPSWQNWPVLEHAIIDNIVPDFPLINKSFNLAYSGHDL